MVEDHPWKLREEKKEPNPHLLTGDLYAPLTMWTTWRFVGKAVATAGLPLANPGLCLVVARLPEDPCVLLVYSPVHQRLGWTWDHSDRDGTVVKARTRAWFDAPME